MEWQQIIQAVLSLIFVIGLLFLTLWLFKYCEAKGVKNKFIRNLKNGNRLNIIEFKRLDTKNALILFQCDSQEFLILLGTSGNTVLPLTPNTSSKKA